VDDGQFQKIHDYEMSTICQAFNSVNQPSHYHVLLDETNDLQLLTFYLYFTDS
ncbi:unnamed protein product, partial [Rotaria sordida]